MLYFLFTYYCYPELKHQTQRIIITNAVQRSCDHLCTDFYSNLRIKQKTKIILKKHGASYRISN